MMDVWINIIIFKMNDTLSIVFDIVPAHDLLNCRTLSHRFNKICSNNALWKRKLECDYGDEFMKYDENMQYYKRYVLCIMIEKIKLWGRHFGSSLGSIHNWSKLYIDNCCNIPKEIVILHKIRFVHVPYACDISENIFGMTQLKKLCLAYNYDENINKMSSLTNLTDLNLHRHRQAEFPSSILFLTKLQTLKLKHFSVIEFPECITILTNLQSLEMSGDSITKIPESITNLTNLKQFVINDRFRVNISKLPNLQLL